MTYLEEQKKQADRTARIIEWTRAGSAPKVDQTLKLEDEQWWGYWHQCGGESVEPPDALFPTEEQALAYAQLVGKQFDTHVGPAVLCIEFRDSYEVPE